MLILRERVWTKYDGQSQKFFEFLVEYKDGELNLLKSLPQRFETRLHEVVNHKDFGKIYFVKSKPFTSIEIVSNKQIVESTGLWLIANDFIKKGEIESEQIKGKRTFYGIQINEQDACHLEHFCFLFKIPCDFPLSLYHGTKYTSNSRESIMTNGLEETNGMLGSGVYLGSFWKAARFAGFTKEYHNQDGEIYRVLCFAKLMETFPRSGWICACCEKNICDHHGLWRLIFDGVHVNVENEKGKLKNDEWAIKSWFLQCTHVANLFPYVYTPFKRDIKIQ